MYNWGDYVAPENIEAFKAEFGHREVHLRHLRHERRAAGQAPGRRDGLRHRARRPRSSCRRWASRASSRSSTCRGSRTPSTSTRVQGPVVGPDRRVAGPEGLGHDRHLYRGQDRQGAGQDLEGVLRPRPKYSGKIVVVDSPGDVFVAPLKALGYSLNSVDKAELEEAREVLLDLAPHVLALDSDTVRHEDGDRGGRRSAWSGPAARSSCGDRRDRRHRLHRPEDGTLFWMDTWVILADAPHPNAAYAFLNFIHEPEVQAEETELQPYATPNDEAKKFIDAGDPHRPGDLPARRRRWRSSRAPRTRRATTQRIDIWEEFKSKIGG